MLNTIRDAHAWRAVLSSRVSIRERENAIARRCVDGRARSSKLRRSSIRGIMTSQYSCITPLATARRPDAVTYLSFHAGRYSTQYPSNVLKLF